MHQFQGSERDTIIYDAVDCYRMQYPGALISSTANNYANRLYNVAVTRARGKMVSIVNMDYMKTKMPSYMIPTKIYFVPVFPLNSNDKIDKKQLKSLIQL